MHQGKMNEFSNEYEKSPSLAKGRTYQPLKPDTHCNAYFDFRLQDQKRPSTKYGSGKS